MSELATPLFPNSGRRPTMKDVAARVGVHQTTVSLALRGHPGIPPATRERIQQAAAALGYRPDPALDAFNFYRLANHPIRSAPLMALITDQPTPTAFAASATHRELYEGAKQQAEKLGFVLERFFVGPGQLSPSRLDHVLAARNISCALLGALSLETTAMPLTWTRLCALKIESFHVQPRLDVISANYHEATRLAVTRLRATGHRRIGLVVQQGDEVRLANLAQAGYLVEHATREWAQIIPSFSLAAARQPVPRREWAEWVERHRLDAIINTVPDAEERLGQVMGNRAPLPMVSFLVRTDAGPQGGPLLNQRTVGMRAVELLAMRWHTNQRGVPAYGSTTFMAAEWRDAVPSAPPPVGAGTGSGY